ncbi:MAG: ABC transporter ATP-binding protein [Acidiphilium sp. 37-64-53]|uniref:dipeptide ABC transporter ATP-binding protein n=1 Tax=Acidiphilium TaxID=522 RepID=UPI000BCD7B21|nr:MULTISPECIES: ABC transporter ATP-binding protein [Acidiphilium]OYW00366.1 MAG: ABC transporter ATP-binding protein [Acidiphilium sp. 37-64-53]OZB25694.1 MAG: ABC transporter ATP-binding protein [Acidiphilium sp. 34-64-41]HQT86550.1 ABC transporter ATP-binding protein [Acidiphilium rubrum]
MSSTALRQPIEPAPLQQPAPALAVENLDVAYRTRGRDMQVLRGISFSIAPGEAYGLVGESGCGKSTAALAAISALPRNGIVRTGSIRVAGKTLASLTPQALRRLRAEQISMVYQDAGRALNPSLTIFRQISEVFELLAPNPTTPIRARCAAMLDRVQIASPDRVLDAYPHQLSGGMLQRVIIAMALAKQPSLLILDEPTTALDATVEAEVLDLIATLRREFSTAILFISHNIGVIERMCDRVGVLYAGSLVETGPTADLLRRPLHPYTTRLLRCLPTPGRSKATARLDTIKGFLPPPGAIIPGCVFAERCDLATTICHTTPPPEHTTNTHTTHCHHWQRAAEMPVFEPPTIKSRPLEPSPHPTTTPTDIVLRGTDICKTFHLGTRTLQAVTNVSFTLRAGETLGIVGESGSGKTTLARLLLGLLEPDPGSIIELAPNGAALKPAAPTAAARTPSQQQSLQIVFQNPDSALNRSHTVRHLIGRALARLANLSGATRTARLTELIHAVRLTDRHLGMRPRQLSGGLKQRVAIARAFAGNPKIVICDEPTSALDVSVQAAILNLLADLQSTNHTSYIFISHDLGVVRYLSDRIAVLYLGRIMEIGPAEAVFEGPHHPYTEALLSSIPTPFNESNTTETTRIRLHGDIPSALNPPTGCVFHTRCPRKLGPLCETTEPPAETTNNHTIACHIPRDQLGRRP